MTIGTVGNPVFKKWDVIKGNTELKGYGLIIELYPTVCGTNYIVAVLSRQWLIRKIQLWAIKKAFK